MSATDNQQIKAGRMCAPVTDDTYAAYIDHKNACRRRMDMKELSNEQFLQVLLDVYAFHLENGGDA